MNARSTAQDNTKNNFFIINISSGNKKTVVEGKELWTNVGLTTVKKQSKANLQFNFDNCELIEYLEVDLDDE